jgi:hypothetical protein
MFSQLDSLIVETLILKFSVKSAMVGGYRKILRMTLDHDNLMVTTEFLPPEAFKV